MSYTSNSKTKYGDEWSDESWSQQSALQGYTDSSVDQQSQIKPVTRLSSDAYTAQQTTAHQVPVATSLTPEDLLFLRSWQRDAFFYRVVPLCILSVGSLFFYNRTKNLPHKVTRYGLVIFGSYTLGKMSYAGELRNRIMLNNSNTPFMQATRRLLKLNPIVSDESGSSYAPESAHDAEFLNTWTEGVASRSSDTYGKQPDLNNEQVVSFNHPDLLENLKHEDSPSTSYEELRARNRGIIR